MKTTAHKSASAKALADRKYHQRIVRYISAKDGHTLLVKAKPNASKMHI